MDGSRANIANKLQLFIQSKNGKRILIIVVILLLLAIIIPAIVVNVIRTINTPPIPEDVGEITYVVDEASGVTLQFINEEPEEDPPELYIIGFGKLIEYGFSYSQQGAVIDAVREYYLDSYPDSASVSFLKDSFTYNADDVDLASFQVISDTGVISVVNLDASGSFTSIKVSINPLE